MRRRIQSRAEEADSSNVNLTPLIDVVFVVLILFILVAPMLNIDKIDLASGLGQENQMFQEKEGVRIEVTANSEIRINERVIPPAQLDGVLAALRKTSPHAPKLFCDKQAPFGTYQTVKGSLEKAGYQELDIVLKP